MKFPLNVIIGKAGICVEKTTNFRLFFHYLLYSLLLNKKQLCEDSKAQL